MSVLQKNKKVAAGIGVAAAAAAVLALGAGTYAAFSDTENVPETTLAAGTLDLTVGGPSVTTSGADLRDLAPGESITVAYTVDNAGTIDGNLFLRFTTSGAENGCAEPETPTPDATCDGAGELLNQLDVTVDDRALGKVVNYDNQDHPLGALAANPAPRTYQVTFTVPTSAGNEIMTDSATINGVLTLKQS